MEGNTRNTPQRKVKKEVWYDLAPKFILFTERIDELLDLGLSTGKIFKDVKERKLIDPSTTIAQFQAVMNRERVKKNLSAREISLKDLKEIIQQSNNSSPNDICEPHVVDHHIGEDYITVVLTSKSKYDPAPNSAKTKQSNTKAII